MWHEGKLPQSPAPPPPSPEPMKDLIPEPVDIENLHTAPPATPATVREKAHLAILKVSATFCMNTVNIDYKMSNICVV